MKSEFEAITLKDNKEEDRFEMVVDGLPSIIEYRLKGDDLYLTHTEVPSSQEGKGIAAALVEKVFEEVEGRNQFIVPLCPYIQSYLKRHPEWQRIVKTQ